MSYWPTSKQVPRPISPSLRDLATVFFRHSGVLIGTFCLVLVAVLLYTFLVLPRYEAQMKILLRRGRSDPVVSPSRRLARVFPELDQ